MPDKLTEAKDRIIKLFTELMAEGMDVLIMTNYGSQPALVIHDGLDRALPGEWVEVTNEDWHPEWSK